MEERQKILSQFKKEDLGIVDEKDLKKATRKKDKQYAKVVAEDEMSKKVLFIEKTA